MSLEASHSHTDELLRSATRFLIEALDNHRTGKITFATIHAVTAVELLLKQRLFRIHPRLILADIDRDGSRTVGLDGLPKRLRAFGCPLATDDEALISDCARCRNELVHHFVGSDVEMRRLLPGILDFAARYMTSVLDADPKSSIPTQLYRTAERILTAWEEEVGSARLSATATGSGCPHACPKCGSKGVLSFMVDRIVHCHLCGDESTLDGPCHGCGRMMPYSMDGYQEYCDSCTDAAGDYAASQYLDWKRGK